MAKDWGTLAGRLRWAANQQPRDGRRRGIRLFQSRMEDHAKAIGADNLGVSMSSIDSYVRAEVPVIPSLEFIQEAARVLRVRESWLAFDDGPPTELENWALEATGEKGEPTGWGPDWNVGELDKRFPGFEEADFSARHMIQEKILRIFSWRTMYRKDVPAGAKDPNQLDRKIAEQIGRILRAPLDILGIRPLELSGWQRTQYMFAMGLAIDSLLVQSPIYLEEAYKHQTANDRLARIAELVEGDREGGNDEA